MWGARQQTEAGSMSGSTVCIFFVLLWASAELEMGKKQSFFLRPLLLYDVFLIFKVFLTREEIYFITKLSKGAEKQPQSGNELKET